MNRKHAAVYLATLMLGILGGICLPKTWYQQPAPGIAVAHSGAQSAATLLADGR